MMRTKTTIINKLGLHARAAAKFVSVASRYGSKVEVNFNNKKVNGKSIMGVMMLAASKGSEIELIVDGEDEQEATNDLLTLIEERFGEAE